MTLLVFAMRISKHQELRWSMGWAEITTAITGSISLVVLIIGFLTASNPASEGALKFMQEKFWALLQINGMIFIGFVTFLMARRIIRASIRQGLRHLDIWYFERNSSPLRPFGDRAIRNTHTRQAYIVYPDLDKIARIRLIEWFTEPCTPMNEFLTGRGYTFHGEQPTRNQLLEGSAKRHIGFLTWHLF